MPWRVICLLKVHRFSALLRKSHSSVETGIQPNDQAHSLARLTRNPNHHIIDWPHALGRPEPRWAAAPISAKWVSRGS